MRDIGGNWHKERLGVDVGVPPIGVQLRRNSEFQCKLAVAGRKQRREMESGGAVRGFSGPGGEDMVEGLPSSADVPNISIRSHSVEMKKGYGAFGGGGATLEKSKLDLSQSSARVKQEVELGGGGGGIGNKNFNGGGDGGDDDGDDDDYFGEDDGDDDGDNSGLFGRRVVVPEMFDRKYVEAILQEWFRTINDLPAGIRQAVELGLISSAQMVRFWSVNARPTMTRTLSRMAPQSVSRAFIGRILADPGFLHKLAFDEIVTICNAVWWEFQHRGERIKQEWDMAAVNVLTLVASTAAMNWALAPSRSYGSTFKYEFQNSIQKLPNHVFDKSYPLREFDMPKRVFSFFYKAAQLSLVGMGIGSAGAGLASLMPSAREKELSVPIPAVSTSASSYGAFMGLSGNMRYQLVNGVERLMQDHFQHLGVVLFFSAALRTLNIHVGDVTRLAFLGQGELPVVHADGIRSQAYRRPSLSSESLTGSVIAAKGLITGLFDGQKVENEDGRQRQSPNVFAKRKVKRKVTAGSR
jgi:hypothetical protein